MLYIASLLLIGLPAVFVAACRLFPALPDFWLGAVFSPVARALSRVSGAVPFPIAEPLFVLVAAAAVFLAFRSRRGLCLLLSCVFAVCALFWAPAYFATPLHPVSGAADREALIRASAKLIDELNGYGAFSMPDDLAEGALEVALNVDLPAKVVAAPKLARYPEWMKLGSLAGLYVPWTFEALVNPAAGAPGVPFTAVHELMHLGGVADEGQANILAYIACEKHGGAFAHSAKLWALKYALQALRELDAGAWTDLIVDLSDSARSDFHEINGFAIGATVRKGRAVEAFLRVNGMAEKTESYGALANYLCMDS